MTIAKHQEKHNIQVISRAAQILRVLAKNSAGLSLGGIAKAVNLPRSTVQRIVASLVEEGLVAAGGIGGGIRLGPEIQSLARAVITTPRERFRPLLEFIAKETGETADLAVLRGDKMLFIDQVVGSQRLRTVSSIGETFPLTSTANGKAALSCLDEFDATRLIMAELANRAPRDRSLTDLLSEIETIREGQLARDIGEHSDGVSALGFALSDLNGEIFAFSLPVPSSRFAAKEPELVKVMAAARKSIVESERRT